MLLWILNFIISLYMFNWLFDDIHCALLEKMYTATVSVYIKSQYARQSTLPLLVYIKSQYARQINIMNLINWHLKTDLVSYHRNK